jgi:hypothetical protein
MTRPTPIGLAALEVIPMTPDQVADLVARARIAAVETRIDAGVRGGRARQAVAIERYRMTPCRVAAHLVALCGGQCSAFEAARAMNEVTRGHRKISHSGVWTAVRRMYPELRLRSGAKPKEER